MKVYSVTSLKFIGGDDLPHRYYKACQQLCNMDGKACRHRIRAAIVDNEQTEATEEELMQEFISKNIHHLFSQCWFDPKPEHFEFTVCYHDVDKNMSFDMEQGFTTGTKYKVLNG